MCGIYGEISLVNKQVNRIKFTQALDQLEQRGPDSSGTFFKDNIALGHRRLSIIDLDSGDQPMFDTNKQLVIVFNGEIYNFLSLREELIETGFTFKTTSDTEVILNGYKKWGIEGILSRLEGMFAFAMYDIHRKKVFIARDKFGEKPLYYYKNNEKFVFTSELKGLKHTIKDKRINKVALNLFLSLSYIPAPFTIYDNVYKLMPGTFFELNLEGDIKEKKYYSLLNRLKGIKKYADFNTAKKTLKSLFKDSIKIRMISDVPIGAFLSGGIDSSIVASEMSKQSSKPINTFTIGFVEKEYDESERAKLVADNIRSNHYVKKIDYKDVVEDLDEIISYYDEPFGDSSAIPSNYVAKLARENVKVVLTGDCADELFAGYEKYLGFYYSARFNKIPSIFKKIVVKLINSIPHTRITNSFLRKAKKVIMTADLNPFELHYEMMCLGFNDVSRKELLISSNFKEINSIIKMRYYNYNDGNDQEKGFYTDLTTVLEGDMLTKVDRICMKNSLEARTPFLDSKIVEFAFSLPLSFKIKGKNKKYILKETFKDFLPKETVKLKKKGFGVPIDYWFKNELKEELKDLLDKEYLLEQGIFNPDVTEQLMSEHFSGKENHKGKLWNLYVFQKWFKNNL